MCTGCAALSGSPARGGSSMSITWFNGRSQNGVLGLRAAGCGADTNHAATAYAIDRAELRLTTCHTDIKNSKYRATTARRSLRTARCAAIAKRPKKRQRISEEIVGRSPSS